MNVIFVDDNEINLSIYRGIAGQLPGCKAVCYTSSAEALEWCRKNEPEIVVVDYNMPAPDGLEFIRIFRSMPDRQGIPLIMITSAADEELRNKALALGANDFFTKPVNIVECLARLRSLLRLREAANG
ncbi:MAG: response regulator [Candidatus Eremiobacteraeota bacterium]|nr:response regulator [Candidatus Eremiobacteraeota bacterium]